MEKSLPKQVRQGQSSAFLVLVLSGKGSGKTPRDDDDGFEAPQIGTWGISRFTFMALQDALSLALACIVLQLVLR